MFSGPPFTVPERAAVTDRKTNSITSAGAARALSLKAFLPARAIRRATAGPQIYRSDTWLSNTVGRTASLVDRLTGPLRQGGETGAAG